MLARLCRLTAEIFNSDYSVTLLWQEEEQAYVPVASWGYQPEQHEILRVLRVPDVASRRLAARLVDEEVVDIPGGISAALLPDALLSQFRSMQTLCLALWNGQTLSGIQICGYRGRATRPQRGLRLARGISQIASLVLANTRLAQELQDANRIKDDFVGMMSHDLRTPLHIIFGYTELLQDETLGPLQRGQKESLTLVRKSAQELLDIVEAILDFRRLKRGSIPLDLQEVQLSDLLTTLARETTFSAYRKPAVTLHWPPATALPPLLTDPLKLKLIVKNLVTNALKFTYDGHVTVSVSWQGESVELKVKDTGSGMAPEVLPLIFQPFWQKDTSNIHRHHGVGLGLYIVQQLVDALGGKLIVTSKVGKGSTFRITLPTVIRQEQPRPGNLSESATKTPGGSQGPL
jgi:signal transduction histidine kinase